MFSKNFWKPIAGALIAVALNIAMIVVQNRNFYDSTFWIGFVIQFAACCYLMYLIVLLADKQRRCDNERKKIKNVLDQQQPTDQPVKE